MADVTREEFDALRDRVAAIEGAPPVTAPEIPAVAITLGLPVIKVRGSTYAIVAKATPNESVDAIYFQIAVRGPGAKDLAMHPGQKFLKGIPVSIAASATGQSGEYEAFLAYSVDGTVWVEGPRASFTLASSAPTTPITLPEQPTTPVEPGDRRIPLVGRSKLPFNSLVFRQTPADADAFASRRGVPVDGLLFFTGRQKWDDFRWHPGDQVQWLQEGRIIVTSMPHAPESEGDQMNQRGANDAYRQQQRDLGSYLAGAGFNMPTHVIRVDWECNGSWYKWSANRPGGADALKQAIRNYVVNLRAGGLTKVRFDLCFNKGPSQAGADFAIFPGSEYIDIIGIDQYDMWAPSFTESDWEREMNKPPSMQAVADFATKNGIMWAMDEGGNTHGGKTMGGDNPFYWDMVLKTLTKNLSNCAWHVTYDDRGAPDTLRHDFERNPKSWDRYKSLWR